MWNEAFALGGPACTIQQFEQITGVCIDHFVVVDFAGFEDMVDAIDGVEVCIPEDIVDPAHGINIEAGTREIEGSEALNYVRARYTLGDGSDIGRIKRQQAFIASMANKVSLGRNAGPRPTGWSRFLDAATKSLHGRPGLENVIKIADLGVQLPGHRARQDPVHHRPVRVRPAAGVPRSRLLAARRPTRLWGKIAADEPLTKRLTSDAISAAKPPGSEAPSGTDDESPSGSSPSPSDRTATAEASAEPNGPLRMSAPRTSLR